MTTLYADKDGNGSIWWRERVIPLEHVFLIRVCTNSWRVEINYKEKLKEHLNCTASEVKDIVEQLKGV